MQPRAILAADSAPINWHLAHIIFFGFMEGTMVLSIAMVVWRRGFSASLLPTFVELVGVTAIFAATLMSGNSPATRFLVGSLGVVFLGTGIALKLAWRLWGFDKPRGDRGEGPARH
jgi:hypothetical protein